MVGAALKVGDIWTDKTCWSASQRSSQTIPLGQKQRLLGDSSDTDLNDVPWMSSLAVGSVL